jgi:putative transposase
MQIANKFRLYPNKEMESKLLDILELHRQTYNMLLAELNGQKEIDKSQIQGIIPDMKICDPRFKQLHSKAMQYECYKLFSNLSALAKTKGKRKVGRLRFKGKGWFKTFTYNQSGFKLIQTGKRFQILKLSKIGDIPIRCHRNIKGKIKQVTIKKEASGKWFASIIEEQKVTIPKQPIKNVVAIDLGLTDLIWDSDNNRIANPRHLLKKAEKLAREQRKLARKKKGSNNRAKARFRVARQYEKLVDARNDFVHKSSRYYVNRYDAIGMEDMPIQNMVHNQLAKHILDVCWGKLRQYISYKAENAGKFYVPVDSKGTTQRCSQCGEIVPKKLWDREHKCTKCGFEAPRDYNSALDIKRLTIIKLLEIGQELPESTLVEMEALPMVTSVIEARSHNLNTEGVRL